MHRNQEPRARDGRGRFAPIRGPNGRGPGGEASSLFDEEVKEEIKVPEEDKIDNPRIDE